MIPGDPTQDIIGYIDLWYFADRVAEKGIAVSEAEQPKMAVEKGVLETKAIEKGGDPLWDYSNYHGISIFYPMLNLSFISDYQQNYLMSEDGIWEHFLPLERRIVHQMTELLMCLRYLRKQYG